MFAFNASIFANSRAASESTSLVNSNDGKPKPSSSSSNIKSAAQSHGSVFF